MPQINSSGDFDTEVDVLVVGAGGAGLVAALAAHEAGATVAVVEKYRDVGGGCNAVGRVRLANRVSARLRTDKRQIDTGDAAFRHQPERVVIRPSPRGVTVPPPVSQAGPMAPGTVSRTHIATRILRSVDHQ